MTNIKIQNFIVNIFRIMWHCLFNILAQYPMQHMLASSYNAMFQVPVTVSNLVSSLQQPLPPAQVSFLPQVGH